MYLFESTETDAINYSKYLLDESKVAPLNSARENLRLSLLQESNSRSLLKAYEEYLPLLLDLSAYCDSQLEKGVQVSPKPGGGILRRNNLWEFRWRSPGSVAVRKNLTFQGSAKPAFTIANLNFEVTFVLISYGYTLCNIAYNLSSTKVGSTELF